jgi:hypothetical protein
LAFVVAADKVTWSAVIIAAFGSSAVGAIVGGLITTWLRGRIEGDAEWRTRLLDSAAALEAALSDLLVSQRNLARSLRHAEQPSPTDCEDAEAKWRLARRAAGLVQLLFGTSSPPFQTANDVLFLARDMNTRIAGETDRLSVQAGEVGVTFTTDQTEAALKLFDAAGTRFNEFADVVNEHVRSAHLRKRIGVRRVSL